MDCNTKRQIEKIVQKEMKSNDKKTKLVITSFLSGVLFFCVAVIFTILIAAPMFL